MSRAGGRIPDTAFPMDIAPGVHLLGNYYFNLGLVSGPERTVLFETGVSAVVDRVIAQLETLRLPPDTLVVSHPHADHITGLPGLRERFPDAELLAAKGATKFVSHPKAGPALVEEDAFIARNLTDLGILPGRPSLTRSPDLDGHLPVEGKTMLELGGGRTLALIPVAGHSPGNLVAWDEETKVLFCSDSLGFHYPERGFWPLFFTGAQGYLETIDMMAGLCPRIICPAHQGPIRGQAVPRALDLARRTAEDLMALAVRETGDDAGLEDRLFQESYRDEFTLYTRTNIRNCNRLLIRRAREYRR